VRTKLIDVWRQCDPDLDAEVYISTALNKTDKIRATPKMILSDAHTLTTLDYRRELTIDLRASTTWSVFTPCTADGVAVWFDSTLIDGVEYTSGPTNLLSTYSQAFFPFRQPLALTPEDTVTWTVHAMDSGPDYVWWWYTKATLATGDTISWRQGALDTPLADGGAD
jgi:protein arginine N-methyltransferase 1